jgi:cell division protein FtsB
MRVFSLRAFWLPVLLTTLMAAFFGAVLGRQARVIEGTLAWQLRLERELSIARAATQRVIAERNALLSSPEAIERVAREELGFVVPGEKVTAYSPTTRPPAPRFVSSIRLTRLEKLLLSPQLPLALPAAVFLASAVVFAAFNACRPSDGRGRPGDAAEDGEPLEARLPA